MKQRSKVLCILSGVLHARLEVFVARGGYCLASPRLHKIRHPATGIGDWSDFPACGGESTGGGGVVAGTRILSFLFFSSMQPWGC